MKFAISNLALPAFYHGSLLSDLVSMGFAGLEVAPNRVWPEGIENVTATAISAYRDAAERAGLQIVGLHSLLDDAPELGLFGGAETLRQTADRLVAMSALCRDLGGRTLILDGGRWRRGMPLEDAWQQCEGFLAALLPRIEPHGTVLCIEPSGPHESDFCVSARECRLLVDYLDHPALGIQMNSKAQTENNDLGHESYSAVRGRLEHFHANEPGLVTLGASGRVDHADVRRHLAAISYRGWVTLKQRVASIDPIEAIDRAASFMAARYLRPDNETMHLRMQDLAHPIEYDDGECDRATVADPAVDIRRLELIHATLAEMRPFWLGDGGDIELVETKGDTVRVRLMGACTSCGLATHTLGGIRRKLMSVLGTPVRVVPAA
jgi:sugar phosphate isomerase/epimerase/Fe-S cluster biogenesis protein NfuA